MIKLPAERELFLRKVGNVAFTRHLATSGGEAEGGPNWVLLFPFLRANTIKE